MPRSLHHHDHKSTPAPPQPLNNSGKSYANHRLPTSEVVPALCTDVMSAQAFTEIMPRRKPYVEHALALFSEAARRAAPFLPEHVFPGTFRATHSLNEFSGVH
jgi:hypothetical protein